MNRLSAVDIQRILQTYRYTAAIEYCERVSAYIELLLRWNRTVALTTVTEPQEVVRFHFGESLFGMEATGMQNGRLADLGSGAGFPGAPIAMGRPDLAVVLIESNGKKAAFLEEIKRELDLNNVTVHRGRAEEVASHAEFDFVTARALNAHGEWLDWSSRRLNADGRMVFWANFKTAADLGRVQGWKWTAPARIPDTKGRFVIVGGREP
ncbi:MAG: 16S rRNA (guanine(527)-N(7))-methyltransferase RsmG [Candidatus Acidiferrales bacterium]